MDTRHLLANGVNDFLIVEIAQTCRLLDNDQLLFARVTDDDCCSGAISNVFVRRLYGFLNILRIMIHTAEDN